MADRYEEIDDEIESGIACGRWRNGTLVHHCLKAGSEECDWECPYGYLAELKREKRPQASFPAPPPDTGTAQIPSHETGGA